MVESDEDPGNELSKDQQQDMIQDMKEVLEEDRIYLGKLQARLENIIKTFDANELCLSLYRHLIDRAGTTDPALTRLLDKHHHKLVLPYVTGFYDHVFFMLAMIYGQVTPIPVTSPEDGKTRHQLVITEEAKAHFLRMRPKP